MARNIEPVYITSDPAVGSSNVLPTLVTDALPNTIGVGEGMRYTTVAAAVAAAIAAGATTSAPWLVLAYPGADGAYVSDPRVRVEWVERLNVQHQTGLNAGLSMHQPPSKLMVVPYPAVVYVCVDDGYTSAYFPLGAHNDWTDGVTIYAHFAAMASRLGIPISLFLEWNGAVGTGKLTIDQMQQLRWVYGWEVDNHNTQGTLCPTTIDAVIAEMAAAREAIANIGAQAYPGNPTYEQTHRVCGLPRVWALPGSHGGVMSGGGTVQIDNPGLTYVVGTTAIHVDGVEGTPIAVGDTLYIGGYDYLVTAAGALVGTDQDITISPGNWGNGAWADNTAVARRPRGVQRYGPRHGGPMAEAVAALHQSSRVGIATPYTQYPGIGMHGANIIGLPADVAGNTVLVNQIANSGCVTGIYFHHPGGGGDYAAETRALVADLLTKLAAAQTAGTLKCLTASAALSCQLIPMKRSGLKTDVFPYVVGSKAAADDVAGTAAYSDITGGTSLLGAGYNRIVTTQVPAEATTLVIASQPDVPRNVNICCHNIDGGTVANAATSYLVMGKFNGFAQTEIILIPAVSMANGKCIYKSGAKPFDSIDYIIPTITGGTEVAGFQVIVGVGSKIGLSNALLTPAEADVVSLTKNGVSVAISSVVTATPGAECVQFGTIASNDMLFAKYKPARVMPVLQGVPDGDFELHQASLATSETAYTPLWWKTITAGHGDVTVENADGTHFAHGGTHAANLVRTDAVVELTKTLSLQPDHTYVLKFWAYVDTDDTAIYVRTNQMSPGARMYSIGGSTAASIQQAITIAAKDGWLQYQVTIGQAVDANRIQLAIGITTNNTKLWIDDVTIHQVSL